MELLQIAKEVLKQTKTPLTVDEIWEKANELTLNDTNAKTSRSMATKLYAETIENSESDFQLIDKNPIRFGLKEINYKKPVLEKIKINKLKILIGIRECIFVGAAIATAFAAYYAYETLSKTADSVDSSTTNSIYSANNSPSVDLLFSHPELYKYFDKQGWKDIEPTDEDKKEFSEINSKEKICEFTNIKTEDCIKQFIVLRDFNNLGEVKKGGNPKDEDTLIKEKDLKYLILSAVVFYADTTEMTFVQRNLIPNCDWYGWWSYYCDLYDESPVLRKFLKDRPEWYLTDEALKKEERDKFQVTFSEQEFREQCMQPKKYKEMR